MTNLKKCWVMAGSMGTVALFTACGAEETSEPVNATGATEESPAETADGNVSDDDGTFTFASSGMYPPFNYQDGNDLVGFDVEIGKALAEEMGREPEPVTNPWQTILSALNSGRFDAVVGSMAITEERAEEVDFSDPYYESGAQIFVSEENEEIQSEADIEGVNIGVVVSSTFEDVAREYSDNIQTYDSDVTALQDLLRGRVDAVITEELVGMYAINANDIAVVPVGEPLYLDQMGIPVEQGNDELLEEINEALEAIMENGTYAEISEKYFGENVMEH